MKKFTFFGFVMLLFCLQSYSQDTCASATPVTPGTITGTTITDATFSADMTLPSGDNAAWFVYTATADGTIDVYSCFGGADTDLAVGSGACGAFTDIVANDDACDLGSGSFFASEVLNYAVVAGNDYYIEWSDQWSAGPFDWTLTFTPAPDCPVPTNFAPTTQSTTTTEFTWTAGGDETSWEVGITQPDATEPDNPVLVSQAAATFGHDPGETKLYWVRAICGVGDVSEWVTLEYTSLLVDPPVNDNCDGALPLDCGITINGNTENATVSGLSATCGSYTSSNPLDLFYSFVANGTSSYTVSLDQPAGETGLDGVVFIYSGPCNDLTTIECSDGGNPEEVFLDAPVAGTYFVRIFDYSGTSAFTLDLTCTDPPACTQAVVDSSVVVESCNPDGTGTFTVDHVISNAGDAGTVFDDGINTYPLIVGTVTTGPYNSGDSVDINVSGVDPDCDFTVGTYTNTCPQPAPANDECVDAEPISCGETVSGSTIDATDSGDNSSNDVWYVLAGTANGEEITASLCGSDYDTYIRVFDSCGGAQVAFNDDATGVCSPQSQVTFTSDGATTYYIMVEGFSTNNGNFDLAITCVPPPSCVPATFTLANGANNCPTEAFFVEVDITDLGTASTVNISDDTGVLEAGVGIGSYFVGPYLASTTVNIAIEDAAGDICNGTDSIITPESCPPENIDCANATTIACGETINATSSGSTGTQEDSGCFMGDNGIWFTFTGTGDDMTVDTIASFDHEVAITSGACGALVNVVCDDQSVGAETHTFTSVLNETYYVYVAHYSSGSTTTGTVDITLSCAAIPTCTPTTVDSSTIVGDCVNNEFSVDVVVSNVGDGTIITDGTNNYAIIAGTVTVGPYVADGTSITLDVVHSDADCDFTIGAFDYVCPPSNDEVPGAIELIIGDTMCDGKTVATNVGATTSVEAGATCGTPEGDVWFKVIVPSTGEVTIETSSSTGINPISDTVMTVYSGVSGALVEVECNDDGGAGLFSLIELTGLNPGDTLFVRVWEFGDDTKGSFDICAWSPSTLGIEQNNFEGFSYYPNPVKGTLNFNTNVSIEKVSVFNMLGQRVINLTETNIQNIDMSSLQVGAYIVQVSINNQTKTIHVIKE
ncbi:T9SS type A sorting domain-containing protein [Lacinutrix gracilariae]|uniref:T9SS type A sorting domain-containing protein n=1 Tax=Lacinutrix gracilariae TaxID=1747198 RepID=A0ABW5K4E5_9FLAO